MARGSQYGIRGQLVGPGVMDQLSWIDRAKAHLHIGHVIPVPTRVFNAIDGTVVSFGVTDGDVLRFVNPGTTEIFITFSQSTSQPTIPSSTSNGPVIGVRGGSEVIVVVPPGTGYIRSSANIRMEVTEDI